MKKIFMTIAILSISNVSLASLGRKVGKIEYYRNTVGTSAQVAIPAVSVDVRDTVGWRICVDPSVTGYLAVSTGADPDVDGVRIGGGSCFECDDCGGAALQTTNVKADAAATGYSIVKFK